MLITKSKKKMGKKALCLIFAFLLSINSFAAVVSDNDGSAFITKAEFDSLKNNFQAQLDSYNTGIDSKIDAAIASYLAGIKVTKTISLKVLYPNPDGAYSNVKWTSSSTYSYDNVANKYWHFYCDYEHPNADWWSKYLYEYGSSRIYNTLVFDSATNTYLFNKVQFNLNVWLRFFRFIGDWGPDYGGPAVSNDNMKNAGTVRWGYDFWPTTLYENEQYKKETHWSDLYGYSCMYYPTVSVEDRDTKNFTLAPGSTSTTYVYVPNKELKGANGTAISDTNYTLVADIWNHTTISNFYVYRDMLVNQSESVVSRVTNQLRLNWLVSYDSNKLPIRFGVLLAKSTNEADKVKINLSCSHPGTVDVAYYEPAIDWYTPKASFAVAAGANSLVLDEKIKKNDNIYLIYMPTSTSVSAYMDAFDVVIEKND